MLFILLYVLSSVCRAVRRCLGGRLDQFYEQIDMLKITLFLGHGHDGGSSKLNIPSSLVLTVAAYIVVDYSKFECIATS